MTMRLDIVTNDAGELVRREHARELGANVVIAIYRLAKLSQLHDLQNQAFTRQLEQTLQVITDYCLRAGSSINVLFANKAVFVAGQLLKGSRGAYEAASELGEILERLGGSELFIERGLTREELFAFAEQISIGFRSAPGSFRSPTPKIRLRVVADAARLRGLELEDLSPDQRIVRTYASAVVIMRRFYEDLQQSHYILPRRIKRIAQSLVDLADGSTPAYLGVTESRNANYDEAGRGVNTAILAVSMAREVTQDRATLSQIAMAAMMHDVARPRAMALASAGGPAMPGMAGPSSLSEDQEDRLAAGAAAVLTALGRVNEPSITRTVLAFEALWLRRQTWLGPVYWGQRQATLHARTIAIARRYNDLLTPEPGLAPPTPDFAVATLSEELQDPNDRTVLRMLVSALGLLPTGTVVQLNTGEVAEVLRGPKGPGERPRIRLVMDERGQPVQQPIEIELAQDTRRTVARVISVDGWRKGLAQGPGGELEEAYDPDADAPQVDVSEPPPPPPVEAMPPPPAPVLPPISPLQPMPMPVPGQQPAQSPPVAQRLAAGFAAWGEAPEENVAPRRDSSTASSIQSGGSGEHNSSASLPSLGSSPSAVAEAMGRMINDSLRPPSAALERLVHHSQHHDDEGRSATNRPGKPAKEPTARGNLAATPLPHVLVYMLDHALTGSVVFEGGAGEDVIYFVGGVPAKIRLQEPVGLLGEMLISGGFLEPKAVDQAVEGAKRLQILLGEYLVGHDLATREAVSWALEAQVLHKIAHIANMPPEISYSYYRDFDALDGWGGGDVTMSAPLNPILASVRNWMDRARVRATLNRIGKHPLVLHDESELSNLALLPEEQATLDLMRAESMSLPHLFKRNVADEEVVSSLIYALAVTRQFSFKGQKKGPMAPYGRVKAASQATAPPISSAMSNPPAASGLVSSQVPSSQKSGPIASPSRQIPAAAAASAGAPAPRSVTPAEVAQRTASGPSASATAGPPVSARKIPSTGGMGATPGPTGTGGARPAPAPQAPARAPAASPATATGTGLPRASPPQIRPITARKPTMVGIQGSAPAETRPSSPGAPPKAAPPPAAAAPPPVTTTERPKTPSIAPDDAKTIAIAAPAFKNIGKNLGKGLPPPSSKVAPPPPGSSPRLPVAGPGGPPAVPPPTSGPPSRGPGKPAPALPSKLAPPKVAPRAPAPTTPKAPPVAAAPKPSPGAPPVTARTPASPAMTGKTPSPTGAAPNKMNGGATEPPDPDSTDEIEIELDDPRPNARSIDIGDMADAEAALEAMQHFRMAEAALQRNDVGGAQQLAQKAVDADPSQPDYVTLLAWIRALGGNPASIEEGIATLSRVLGEDPANERALLYRGKLFARTSRLQEALKDLTELAAANPQNRDAQNELRLVKSRLG